ncbi:hypothetical protein P175DRAFT_0150132 [Aspergillus ochraceoroseus IBT 24754]|uniref:Uncharacterized protein n=1 Tax=Aspergillus ochraceoroseus IBT 24754 TaxID=1392256 RepID=A0A2T5M315_9EURO|nr:uncharacterized protein P175DRAFT_0150132 [Aspergillus ochraceoroseus IBT 24754]PTU22921.1 hypothetical protein P175DRAFT_0150132 [Aspergillus ochraceoroseus IBT 24754]
MYIYLHIYNYGFLWILLKILTHVVRSGTVTPFVTLPTPPPPRQFSTPAIDELSYHKTNKARIIGREIEP